LRRQRLLRRALYRLRHQPARPGLACPRPQPTLADSKARNHWRVLIADLAPGGSNPLFRIKNIGNKSAPATLAKVTCYVNGNSATGAPCQPQLHYVDLPGVVLPPGTSMSAPNVWRVPIGGLDAITGFTTFGLNIRSAPGLPASGLKFTVCADAGETVVESNESNNCYTFSYSWPN
jgi:hypothetical protein